MLAPNKTNNMSTQEDIDYVKVARTAYRLTCITLPQYSHPKSPHRFTLPQLAACVLVRSVLNLSYRKMSDWLSSREEVYKELELPCIPDHTTLQRTFKKLQISYFKRMEKLIQEMGSK